MDYKETLKKVKLYSKIVLKKKKKAKNKDCLVQGSPEKKHNQ